MNRLLPAAVMLAALTAAACSAPPPRPAYSSAGLAGGPGARASKAEIAACRQRADEIYLKQNRSLLSERDTRDTPYASAGIPDNTARGLSELFGRDQNFQDCLNSAGPAAPATGSPVIETGTSPAMSPNSAQPVSALPQ